MNEFSFQMAQILSKYILETTQLKKKIQEQEETIQKYMDMNEKQINDSIEHQQSLLELRNKTRIDIEIESINKLEEIIQLYFH